jgi:hypothetical protein
MQYLLALTVAISSIAFIKAECPGGCSGHGMCGAQDMCTCYRNWKGNDCNDRVCPYAHAFVTSPQGDLNFDGDMNDNSGKFIVDDETGLKAFVDIDANSATMTFDSTLPTAASFTSLGVSGIGSVDEVATAELIVGDKIKVADEVFTIAAVVTAGKTYTLDHKRLTRVENAHVMKFLGTQSNPRGDWEQWVGDFSALGDEGHYYMECANRGVCDRKTGECKCFEGYTGAACQVHACPSECNYKGTCESVSSLASLQPKLLQVTGSGSSTSSTTTVTLNTTAPSTLSASGGDTLVIHGVSYVTASVSGHTVTLASPIIESFKYGTEIYQVMNYDLWDAEQGRACNCDSIYTGMDCSKKKCHKGDDPLTTTGSDPQCASTASSTAGYSPYNQANEKQTAYLDSPDGQVIGTFKIKFKDEYGKTHTTAPIDALPLVSKACVVAGGALKTITWAKGYRPGCDEVQKGDYIQIGNSIRQVATRTVVDVDSASEFVGQCQLASVTTTDANMVATTGAPCYRLNANVEIKNALLALPNSAVKGVTVRHMSRDGTLIQKPAQQKNSGNEVQFVDPSSVGSAIAVTAYAQKQYTGSILRFGDQFRRVLSFVTDTTANTRLVVDADFSFAATAIDGTVPKASGTTELLYASNGFTYEVTFESGCSSDADCQSNGISIRGGVDIGLSDSNAVCHPSGVCVCSSLNYFGPGCTGDGRGNHAGASLSNSGDVPDMEFDCADMTASVLAGVGDVEIASPNKITMSATPTVAAGDAISINGQTRNVVLVSGNDVTVDNAFVVSSISGAKIADDAPVFKHKHSTVTCGATDTPKVETTSTAGSLFSWATTATKTLTAAGSGFVRARDHVNIGDRVLFKTSNTDNQIRTVDGFTGNGNEVTAVSIGEQITNCAGSAAGSAINNKALYKLSKGTTEAVECSRRGICNEDSGTCECFNGYTSYNCDTQNALAM